LTRDDVELYDKDAKVSDHSWEYWIVQWWRWILSISKDVSPSNDRTGEFSAINQKGEVYNLGGGPTGMAAKYWRIGKDEVTREIHVPNGKDILVPVAVGIVSISEFPSLFPDRQSLTREYVETYTQSPEVSILEATIDGRKITKEDFKNYYVTTDIFDVVYVENNIFDAPPGPTLAVSDGYWLLVNPHKQNFIIEFAQRTEENRRLGYYAFEYVIKCEVQMDG
jgi:hypothetical protein